MSRRVWARLECESNFWHSTEKAKSPLSCSQMVGTKFRTVRPTCLQKVGSDPCEDRSCDSAVLSPNRQAFPIMMACSADQTSKFKNGKMPCPLSNVLGSRTLRPCDLNTSAL